MLPPRTHAAGAGKRKTARTSGAVMLCRGDFLSGICSRASSLAAQSTVASPARLLDPVVSESLLMQVPIIVERSSLVKSFFDNFSAIVNLRSHGSIGQHRRSSAGPIDFGR